jgi:Flp pilus assembly protein TadG
MSANFCRVLKARIESFKQSTAGVAAVEFAMILPILVLMTLGVAEVTHAVIAHKKFQKSVAMIGDLVSRENSIGTNVSSAQATMDGMMKAAEQAMYPFDTTALKMSVTAISSNPNTGALTVAWAYPYHGYPVTACGQPKSMPAANMIAAGNSAVLVEAQFIYTPIIASLVPGFTAPITFTDQIAHAPRGQCPDYAGNKCICP